MSEQHLPTADEVIGELSRSWGWLLAAGIILILFGVAGLYLELVVTMATILYFGVFMIAGGLLVGFGTFQAEGWKAKLWHLLVSIAYIVGGAVMCADPAATATWATLFIASALVAAGCFRIVAGLQLRGTDGWILTVIAGISGIVLGALLITDWPGSGTYAIGMFVSIDLLMQGISLCSISLAARRIGAEAADLVQA